MTADTISPTGAMSIPTPEAASEGIVNPARFVHLRVHSPYSLLEGACRIENIRKMALDYNMPALAITDRNNMFGTLEIADNLSRHGIQPIPAVTITLYANKSAQPDEDDVASIPKAVSGIVQSAMSLGTVVLYAKNAEGYQSLMRLVTHIHTELDVHTEKGCTLKKLAQYANGLICLSGGTEGVLNQALRHGNDKSCGKILAFLMNTFRDNFYIELQRYQHFEPAHVERKLIALAYQQEIPLVATNQCFFMTPDDHLAHEVLLCIADGQYLNSDSRNDDAKIRRHSTPDHYFKSPEDMCALFADVPEALVNTIEIARRCSFMPGITEPALPAFIPDDESARLNEDARTGLQKRLARLSDYLAAPREAYEERLEYELDVISRMGFAGYFLIVADFITWAKKQDIAVGPGRGSGAGSIVAWALTITELDPIRFGLIFERFLNPERVSMPDFDIDFCQSRRDEVIHYVRDKYGSDHVAQIITFGKLQARLVMRDVGRVLQLPYMQVDRLCKTVPTIPGDDYCFAEALETDPVLRAEREADQNIDEMLKICVRLEGLYRHSSTHAAGVVISDRPLYERVPLYCETGAQMLSTQFSMKWVEAAGLVKFDFLGLKTLTVIEHVLTILAAQGTVIDLSVLPLDDSKTYAMLGQGDTTGVFQLEGAGMRGVLCDMKPDRFEDIIALVALYRPGPMDMIPTFIARKHGHEPVTHWHPDLVSILDQTQGVALYQEQVMQIAQTLSGFTLGEADLLRQAMGKKKPEEMRAQKARFIEGARARGVDASDAEAVFKKIERFAGYGFNKSHATAYAMIAYQTAYLKANYPSAFYAASMSLDCEHPEKLEVFCQDARAHGLKVRPPDVNSSGIYFEVVPDDRMTILYGLAAVRNVGAQAVTAIVAARETGGAFTDIFDFTARVGTDTQGGGLHRRLMENLISAGAFDSLTGTSQRAQLMGGTDMLLGVARSTAENQANQQSSLFGARESQTYLKLPASPAWNFEERLAHELEAIGFYLSEHPIVHYRQKYSEAFEHLKIVPMTQIETTQKSGLVAGVLHSIKRRKSKKGNHYGLITLSDETSMLEAFVFAEALNDSAELLVEGKVLFLGIEVTARNDHSNSRNNNKGRGQVRFHASTICGLADKLRENSPNDRDTLPTDTSWRIYIEDVKAIEPIKTHIETIQTQDTAENKIGTIVLIIMSENHEIELTLPGHYALPPKIGRAIRATEGVCDLKTENNRRDAK